MSSKTKMFRDFVEEQLEGIRELRIHPMFGGFGLYSGELFFGIINEDRLFLKTTNHTATRYTEVGMSHFVSNSGRALKRYYQVPIPVLERKGELADWVREALAVAEVTE